MVRANLFLANTDFKLLETELICEQHPIEGRRHLLTYSPQVAENCERDRWDSVHLLRWWTGSKLRKHLGMRDRILTYLDEVVRACDGADEVVLHAITIHSESCNYMIRAIPAAHPGTTVRVHLLMDGILNLRRRPMGPVRRMPQRITQLRWIMQPRINYYTYRGDRLGTDDDIVERIYMLEGFPHEYDPAKVVTFRLDKGAGTSGDTGHAGRRVLVVGSPIREIRGASHRHAEPVGQEVERVVRELRPTEVLYKPHPLETKRGLAFCRDDYEVLTTPSCVERVLATQPFDALVGNCSSALINAKLFFPRLPVYCCGLDTLEQATRKRSSIHAFRIAAERHGVTVVPPKTPVAQATPNAELPMQTQPS